MFGHGRLAKLSKTHLAHVSKADRKIGEAWVWWIWSSAPILAIPNSWAFPAKFTIKIPPLLSHLFSAAGGACVSYSPALLLMSHPHLPNSGVFCVCVYIYIPCFYTIYVYVFMHCSTVHMCITTKYAIFLKTNVLLFYLISKHSFFFLV